MGMNPKGKKHRLFHISRRNILDFVSTFAILLVAAGVSSLLVRLNDGRPGEVRGGSLTRLTDTLYLLRAQSGTVTIMLEKEAAAP